MALPCFWEENPPEVRMLFVLNADEVVGFSLVPGSRPEYAGT
jgi:hypothetical protein